MILLAITVKIYNKLFFLKKQLKTAIDKKLILKMMMMEIKLMMIMIALAVFIEKKIFFQIHNIQIIKIFNNKQ